jgi:membrane protease YdiL (CAAX protease family)
VGQGLIETTLRHNPLKMFIIVAAVPFLLGVVLGALGLRDPSLWTVAILAFLSSVVVFSAGMLSVVVLNNSRKP